MPFFVATAALSDRIGRKRIIMAGCLIAAVSYVPIYRAMQAAAGSEVVTTASQRNPVTGAQLLTPQAMVDGELRPAEPVLGYVDLPTLLVQPGARTLILLVFIQVLFATMVYGPMAAYLVEAFPAKIRYTALSLPYHIGNGVFGGLVPVVGLAAVASTGNIYAGLYYPIAVASLTFVVGSIFLRESHHVQIWDEVGTI
jgi:MFS family permease